MGTNNGGDALNAIRDESGEVGMKMSTGVCSFGEVSSKPTGCFGEVQAGRKNSEDFLSAVRMNPEKMEQRCQLGLVVLEKFLQNLCIVLKKFKWIQTMVETLSMP